MKYNIVLIRLKSGSDLVAMFLNYFQIGRMVQVIHNFLGPRYVINMDLQSYASRSVGIKRKNAHRRFVLKDISYFLLVKQKSKHGVVGRVLENGYGFKMFHCTNFTRILGFTKVIKVSQSRLALG